MDLLYTSTFFECNLDLPEKGQEPRSQRSISSLPQVLRAPWISIDEADPLNLGYQMTSLFQDDVLFFLSQQQSYSLIAKVFEDSQPLRHEA